MLSVHNKIWGTLITIESSTNVHIKINLLLSCLGYVKKIEIMKMIMISYNFFTKTFNSQKHKINFSRKIPHVAIRSCFYTLDLTILIFFGARSFTETIL